MRNNKMWTSTFQMDEEKRKNKQKERVQFYYHVPAETQEFLNLNKMTDWWPQ